MSETGWIYVIADPARAGSGLSTMLVEDLGAFVAGVRERGIDPGPIETIGERVRRVIVTDPDGNRLQVGQPPADT